MTPTQILARELALRDCPKQEFCWTPRGGCSKSCALGYHQDHATDCWIMWGNEKSEESHVLYDRSTS